MKHISYDNIVYLLQRGIVSRKHVLDPVEYAYEQGLYLGCPGKEVHDSILLFSSDEQKNIMNIIVNSVSSSNRAVHMTVFWRYFFGVQDRNGCINDKVDVLSKLKQTNTQWDEYFELMEYFLIVSRKKNKSAYLIASEMYAHRLGDQYLLSKEQVHLDRMIAMYNIAMKLGEKLGVKNSFSAPCWCCCYLFKFGLIDECKKYGKMFLENCNKYCTSKGVKNKMTFVVDILHKISTKEEWMGIMECGNNFKGITHKQWLHALNLLGINNGK